MGALQEAQFRHDHAEPVDDTARRAAIQFWLDGSAEQLVMGGGVIIPQRSGPSVGVTQDQFIRKVQEHLICRQEGGMDDEDWFAQIVIDGARGARVTTAAQRLLGPSDDARGKLFEIAEEMLKPFAERGVQHEAEEALL